MHVIPLEYVEAGLRTGEQWSKVYANFCSSILKDSRLLCEPLDVIKSL